MIEAILSNLESPQHNLHVAYGLTLVPPNLHGCEAFPTLRTLSYIRITWAHLPTAPQVLGISLGPPCAHGVSSNPHGEVCDTFSIHHIENLKSTYNDHFQIRPTKHIFLAHGMQ